MFLSEFTIIFDILAKPIGVGQFYSFYYKQEEGLFYLGPVKK